MEPSWLMWGLFTFIMVPGCVTELCDDDPPEISYATFKALAYKNGTVLNCECKKGFRRKNGLAYIVCTENSSWDKKCQCESISHRNTGRLVTPPPKQQKKTTERQSQTQPGDQAILPGHCRDPAPWEHEDAERIYRFVTGQTVHYQCIPGYKALQRGPATSVCRTICGEARWSWPQLTCIEESEHHQFAGEEASGVSMDALPESETSCPPTSTDSQQHTATATTAETFIFTREYQVAVAGCVFLLIGVLLLSGLAWQRRRRKSRRTI